jgi:endonuclease/exonuclease/phosphatase family metal-dependent hydrolase
MSDIKRKQMKKLSKMRVAALAAAVAFGVAADVPARPVTMMSFNVRMGCGLNGNFRLEKGSLGCLPEVARVIRNADPDWVAVQEIDRLTERAGGIDQTAELARLCGLKGYFVKKIPLRGGDYGLAILSKEEPLSVSKIMVPGSAHTRALMVARFRDYTVVCTHFPLKPHLREVAAEIARLNLAGDGKPVFLAGDINAEPAEKSVEILKKDFTVLSDETKPTFPSDVPRVCIDYIFVDKAHAGKVKVLERQTIAAPEATDHCALVVKAELSGDK